MRWSHVRDWGMEKAYQWERLQGAYRHYTGQALIVAPPLFITEAETVWTTSSASKTTASVTAAIGDPFVLIAINDATEGGTFDAAPTNTNTAQTWTLRQEVTQNPGRCRAKLWTAVAVTAQAMTVSLGAQTGPHWGMNLLQFRRSDGIGTSNKADAADAAPSLSLTVKDHSAVIGGVGDYEAAATDATWPAGVGTWVKVTTVDDGSDYSVHIGYTLDAGGAGAKTINPSLTGNAAPDYSLVAQEVLGSRIVLSPTVMQAVHRAASY